MSSVALAQTPIGGYGEPSTAQNNQPLTGETNDHFIKTGTEPASPTSSSQLESQPICDLWENLLYLSWLVRAYAADSLAQSFHFEEALALDNQIIEQINTYYLTDNNERITRLLANLHLLRGQHRLYLYEWDAVLADYNAAIALVPGLPRAYYLRGLLYYTTNERQNAYNDFTYYLALETDPNSPTIPLAEHTLAELENLLATPSAD